MDMKSLSYRHATLRHPARLLQIAQYERGLHPERVQRVEGSGRAGLKSYLFSFYARVLFFPVVLQRLVKPLRRIRAGKELIAVGLLIMLPTILTAAQPTFTSRPLNKQETSTYFASNNPLKKLLFENKYRAYELTIANPTDTPLVLKSGSCTPRPLQPQEACKKLSQSKAVAPLILGAGWTAILINVLGFSIIPSIVSGVTILIAGVIGMNNSHLPSQTQHTIKHLLADGIHNYSVPAHDQIKLIILLSSSARDLSFPYTIRNNKDQKLAVIALR
jgi:hypothetical protein